jgi:hypothetical protein
MTNDFRFALGGLRCSPGFARVAIFSPALAIRVNIAMFALVNAILLRPILSPIALRPLGRAVPPYTGQRFLEA